MDVVREMEVAASPEQVWDAITDAEQLSSWFGGPARIEPWPGGRGRFLEPDGSARDAVVLVAVPGRRLIFDWWPSDLSSPPTTVELTLGPAGPGFVPPTRVRVVETVAGARSGRAVA